ncbi:hypothetical protein HOE31_02915 [bacterium]|jgi:hypothetical protein|nr:hypothetical protein [bacterium]MBT4121875.1 hypothetical protein [bacterium]MBT4334892.1 hypothetical protein [bacterium]MBT4495710.1 hypothetical protein [bacterium]MBT4763724.1 hypothetical protein [bacterium]
MLTEKQIKGYQKLHSTYFGYEPSYDDASDALNQLILFIETIIYHNLKTNQRNNEARRK